MEVGGHHFLSEGTSLVLGLGTLNLGVVDTELETLKQSLSAEKKWNK